MARRGLSLWVLSLICCAVAASASAQDGSQKALAKAQFMLRQVNAEKTALEQKVAELQKQVDALNSDLKATKAAAGEKQESLSHQLTKNMASWRADSEKAATELQGARSEIGRQQAQIATLETKLNDQTQNFSRCYSNNKKLYEVNQDLLGKYQQKGPMDALAQKEPFTGLSQVEIENLVQDYQYRLDDLKLPVVDVEIEQGAAAVGSSN